MRRDSRSCRQHWTMPIFGVLVLATITVAAVGEVSSSKRSNRYLAHIFNKYGSQGTIGFEGLEHLMHSLHLGGVEFSPTHTVDEHRPKDFKLPEIALNVTAAEHRHHDHQHDGANETLHRNDSSATATTEGELNESSPDTLNQLDLWNEEMWLDTKFQQMHDPKHRHPRHHQDDSLKACLSPASLLHMAILHRRHSDQRALRQRRHKEPYERHEDADDGGDEEDADDDETTNAERLAGAQITPDMFLEMCPLLLLQLDQRSCADGVSARRLEAPLAAQLFGMQWIYASISILIISMCGLLGVAIVPFARSDNYQHFLQFLVALAVGTLCGDALMHLLPHALVPHQHEGDDGDTPAPPTLFTNGDRAFEPVWLCFCAFMTALAMYALETSLPLLGGGSGHGHGHGHSHGHGHGHSHSAHPPAIEMEMRDPKTPAERSTAPAAAASSSPSSGAGGDEGGNMLADPLAKKRSSASRLTPVAFMVLLGDGLHNITDGLAIGAAFAVDPVTGMATALAVLCHELPHELGDFALLLQTGVSVRRALVFNVLSSVLSVLGMIVGLAVAGSSATMVRWIYAGTSGTFLYIALADLVPEMRGGEQRQQSGREVAVQVCGVLAGGLLMLVIAMYEERLKMLFD